MFPAKGGPTGKTKSGRPGAPTSPADLQEPLGVTARQAGTGALLWAGSDSPHRLSPRGGRGQDYTPRAFPPGRRHPRPGQGQPGAFGQDDEQSQPAGRAAARGGVSVLSALCSSISVFRFVFKVNK